MTLDQIKTAVLAGKTVHWQNKGYIVQVANDNQWHILFTPNNHYIGLTWLDGVTMNGKPEQFYIGV